MEWLPPPTQPYPSGKQEGGGCLSTPAASRKHPFSSFRNGYSLLLGPAVKEGQFLR